MDVYNHIFTPWFNVNHVNILFGVDDVTCKSALAFKIDVGDNYLQVTLATNGKSADFTAVEEEPWKHEK